VRRGHGAREHAERARVEWRASDLTRNEKDDTCVSMCERAVCFAGVDLNSKRELSGARARWASRVTGDRALLGAIDLA